MQSRNLQPPRIEWVGNTPRSLDFADVYYTSEVGIEESRYVFLEHNDLPARWHGARHFTIGETGFGTGLNFLLTWDLWRRTAPSQALLHYVSLEGFPLARADMARAAASWPSLAVVADELCRIWRPPEPGFRRLVLDGGRVHLTLMFGGVAAMLDQLRADVDAWFLDGFAPERNPEMWSDQVLRKVAANTAGGGTFATFTAASKVRRGLEEAGFQVRKDQGFGSKREMSWGRLERPSSISEPHPWYALPKRCEDPARQAVVVGAGLAGSAAARALAERGWRVTLIDRRAGPGRAASGNPAGVVMPMHVGERSLTQRWYSAGYQHTLDTLGRHDFDSGWSPCGVLASAWSPRARRRQSKMIQRLHAPRETMHPVSPHEASDICGMRVPWHAVHHPEGGWLNPPEFCAEQLAQWPDCVTTLYGQSVLELLREGPTWSVRDTCGAEIARAPVVVLACGAELSMFAQTQGLPAYVVRGQITVAQARPTLPELACVVCGPGYVIPLGAGRYCFGATYQRNAFDAIARDPDNRDNLDLAACSLPELAGRIDASSLRGRAGLRVATSDHLPLVGPVVDATGFRQVYADLHHGRHPSRYPSAPYHPGLYVSNAHGSRGLVSAPLAGELLAALVCREPLPVELDLLHAIHPARFLVRELKRRHSGSTLQ